MLAEFGADTYRELTFPPAPADRPYVYVNMVASIDGKAVIGETERGLGSRTDQLLMRRLRYHADMVLNGAGTARTSGSGSRINDPALQADRIARGLTANPWAAIISNSGELDVNLSFFTSGEFASVVFLGPNASVGAEARLRATGRLVIRIGGDEPGLREMLATCRERMGVGRLLVEGGPSVNGVLLAAGLVDEIFVTTA